MNSFHSLIQRKMIILPHDATVSEAARAMSENQVGCALISGSEGNAEGILTDRDLARYWTNESPSAERTIDEIMSYPLISANERMGLTDIIRLMETHGVRRIPIVNKDKAGVLKFIGIVSLDDLMAAGLIDSSALSRIVKRQIGRRLLHLGRPHAMTQRSDARSHARKLQTLQKFYQHIRNETGLSEDQTPPLTHFLLGSLFMRISVTSALHFLAQLPDMIRDTLFELPPGPDRLISTHTISDELRNRLNLNEMDSLGLLKNFIRAISTWLTPGQVDHLRAELPHDFGPYFEEAQSKKRAA